MTWRAVVLAACVLATGCARETEPRFPLAGAYAAPPIALRAQETRRLEFPDAAPPGSSFGVPTASYGEAPGPGAGAAPPPAPLLPTRLSSTAIPDGNACLAELDRLGVKYAHMEHERGIQTPVVVLGPIGGIEYRAFANVQLVADCRLVVALDWIAPVLRGEGVTEARFSGAYSYRMSRVGRLSLHAYGLAIDVHQLVVGGQHLTVEHAFARGLGDGCAPTSPSLNRIACRLKALGLFRELLTPDSNSDHYNHFHFGILPTGTTLAMLPRAPKPKPKHVPAPKHEEPAAHPARRALLVEREAGIQLIEGPEEAKAPAHDSARAKHRHRAEPASNKKAAAQARHHKHKRHRRRAESTRKHEKRHRTGDKKR